MDDGAGDDTLPISPYEFVFCSKLLAGGLGTACLSKASDFEEINATSENSLPVADEHFPIFTAVDRSVIWNDMLTKWMCKKQLYIA